VAALRKVVAELERLDAAFIGLCVGHVLEQHASTTGSEIAALAAPVTAASRRAIARSTAPATANPRKARAEPILVRSTD
jgi:hypothetical protein